MDVNAIDCTYRNYKNLQALLNAKNNAQLSLFVKHGEVLASDGRETLLHSLLVQALQQILFPLEVVVSDITSSDSEERVVPRLCFAERTRRERTSVSL